MRFANNDQLFKFTKYDCRCRALKEKCSQSFSKTPAKQRLLGTYSFNLSRKKGWLTWAEYTHTIKTKTGILRQVFNNFLEEGNLKKNWIFFWITLFWGKRIQKKKKKTFTSNKTTEDILVKKPSETMLFGKNYR